MLSIKKYKFFQDVVTVALNHKETGKNREKISRIKLFIDKHNWKVINYPSKKDDRRKFKKNNLTIALNVL